MPIGCLWDCRAVWQGKSGRIWVVTRFASARWHAPNFLLVSLYLVGNPRIVVQDEFSYFETALDVAATEKKVFPLGYESTQIPLTAESTSAQSICLRLKEDFLPKTVAHRPVYSVLPFVRSVNAEGAFSFHLPAKAYQNWIDACHNCQWIGKTQMGWVPIATKITNNGGIVFENPIYLKGYSAIEVSVFWEEKPLLVAEALTPNGVGINDVWSLENIDHYPTAHLRVYGGLSE